MTSVFQSCFFLLYICIHISFIFYFHFLTIHSEIRSQCSASSINLNGSPRIVVIVIAGDAFRSDHYHPACHYCESVSECNGAVPKCRAIACENERIVCVCVFVCVCSVCVCVTYGRTSERYQPEREAALISATKPGAQHQHSAAISSHQRHRDGPSFNLAHPIWRCF